MAKVIKDVKVGWAWDGDSYAIYGFNVAIAPAGTDPKTSSTSTGSVPGDVKNYTFKDITLDDTIQYTAWVQAVYEGGDSDWVSTGNLTVSDDGSATIASQAQVDDKIGNLKIGGTNIVLGSDFSVRPLAWNGATVTVVEGSYPNSVTVQKPSGNSYGFTLWSNETVKKNVKYTLSFEAKTDGTLDSFNYICMRGDGVSNTSLPSISADKTNTTGFVKYTLTFMPSIDFVNAGILLGTTSPNTATFEIRKVQLEEGDKATDWSLAPADINAVKTKVDAVTTTENNATVIDGNKILTNSVTANKINAKGLTVNNGTKNTLVVDTNGNVTIDGTVFINSSTQFASGYDPTKISVGARNLLMNSRFSTSDLTNWSNWNTPTTRVVETITDLPGFDKAVKFVTSGSNQGLLQNVPAIIGNKYTISAWVKSESGQPVLQVYDGSGYPSKSMDTADIGKNRWVKLSLTFTANASTIQVQIGRGGGGSNGTYWFTGVKVEEGTLVSGWVPSAEDVENNIDTQVSNIKVGGRNILTATSFDTPPAIWGDGSIQLNVDNPNSVTVTKGTNSYGVIVGSRDAVIQSGKEYTLSFDVQTSGPTAMDYVYIISSSQGNLHLPDVPLNASITTSFVRYSLTFKATKDYTDAAILIGLSSTNAAPFTVKAVKLESGNKATDWSPAPEDLSNQISLVVDPASKTIRAEEIASAISVEPNAINAISENINLKGKVTFNSFTSWIYDADGSIITNADQPDYDPNNPLYLSSSGEYLPLDSDESFFNSLFTKEDGRTRIDGSLIKTGTIMAKDANFRGLAVYGDLLDDAGNIVGSYPALTIDDNGNLSMTGTAKSRDFETGKTGWQIKQDGTAEFNASTFRGDIELGYYDPTADSFVVTGGLLSGNTPEGKDLRFWAGTNKDDAPFKVFSDGSLEANKGTFNGTFSGEVQVGNILIIDNPDVEGDASITIKDNDGLIDKVVINEQRVDINTLATFGSDEGTFLTIDSSEQVLEFGAKDFKIDYANNLIQMKNFSIQGNDSLNFISDGTSTEDFVFTNTSGSASVNIEGSMTVRDDIQWTDTLTIRKSSDAGNKGIDFVFI